MMCFPSYLAHSNILHHAFSFQEGSIAKHSVCWSRCCVSAVYSILLINKCRRASAVISSSVGTSMHGTWNVGILYLNYLERIRCIITLP